MGKKGQKIRIDAPIGDADYDRPLDAAEVKAAHVAQMDRIAQDVAGGSLYASTSELMAVWLAFRPATLREACYDDLAAWQRLDERQRAWVVSRSRFLQAVIEKTRR